MSSAKAIGAIVHKLRREMQMTLKQFGAEVGAGVTAVFNWETGVFLPDKEHLARLRRLAPGYADELDELWAKGRDEVSERLRGRGEK